MRVMTRPLPNIFNLEDNGLLRQLFMITPHLAKPSQCLFLVVSIIEKGMHSISDICHSTTPLFDHIKRILDTLDWPSIDEPESFPPSTAKVSMWERTSQRKFLQPSIKLKIIQWVGSLLNELENCSTSQKFTHSVRPHIKITWLKFFQNPVFIQTMRARLILSGLILYGVAYQKADQDIKTSSPHSLKGGPTH